MQINSEYPNYTPTYSGTIQSHQKAQDFTPSTGSRWDTKDTVEISLSETAPGPKGSWTWGGEPSAGYIAERKSGIKYTDEELKDVKERFSGIFKRQKDITSKLQKILESTGGKLGMGDKIKVEIGRDGKAAIGGISDAKLARKLENEVNRDKVFLKEIKDFQDDEAAASRDLKAITGLSLKDYKNRINDLQMGKGMDRLTGDNIEGWMYDREQCINLEDQDLYIIDQELATMVSEYFTTSGGKIGTHAVDISGGNNILLDAESTVNGTFNDIMKKVHDYLSDVNEGVRKTYADDPEEMKRHLVNLSGVTIRLNSDGDVLIDGSFSESGDSDDVVKNVIRDKIFKEELKINPYSGEKDDYFIAAQYLENKYDLAFDGSDSSRKLETVYQNGRVQSRLSSPEEEARLKDEIVVEAKTALKDIGIDWADSLDIEIGDNGKLSVTNMPQDKTQHSVLTKALETLNKSIENRTNENYNNLDKTLNNPIERLKGLMSKMDVFLPGGVSHLKNMQVPIETDEK